MDTIPITVNVSTGFYEKLRSVQKQLREKEGKKTALSKILSRLAQIGAENLQNEHNSLQNEQNNIDFAHLKDDFTQNLSSSERKSGVTGVMLSGKGSEFYNELVERAELLREREEIIKDREDFILEEKENIQLKRKELMQYEQSLMKREHILNQTSLQNEIKTMVGNSIKQYDAENMSTSQRGSEIDLQRGLEKMDGITKKIENIEKILVESVINKKLYDIFRQSEMTNHEIKNLEELIRRMQQNEKSWWEKPEVWLTPLTVIISNIANRKKSTINKEEMMNEIKSLMTEWKNEENNTKELGQAT